MFSISHGAPLWWGQLGLVAIEATAFMLVFATYFYLRLQFDVWPPPGDWIPGPTLPTIGIIVLVLSAVPSYLASEAAKKNDRGGVIAWLGLNVLLAAVSLAIRIWFWHGLAFKWYSDAYGSIVWAILGLHTVDYVALMIETIVLIAIAISGRFGEKQRLGVHMDSITWYFIVASWIPFYVLLDLVGPRVLGT
jgi:cytochrome c oxidase subunit I+III